jgi:uncharacterized protein (TIGR02391 family)
LESEIVAAVHEVFGADSREAGEFEHFNLWGGGVWLNMSPAQLTNGFRLGVSETITRLEGFVKRLEERLADEAAAPGSLIAQGELTLLHSRVQEVAGKLFDDGHYGQAVLQAAIALNQAVRSKSGEALDGVPLMNKVFSQKGPTLVVSDDADERLGFMWLFAGAAMGIRNPKAHRVSEEKDPVRAFEWLAFVSALFRVLDDSKKP